MAHLLPPAVATTITLLLLLLILSPPPPATADPIPVLDTDGNPVQQFTDYYILPATDPVAGSGRGGGMTTISTKKNPYNPKTCTFYVGQNPNPTSLGLPIKFFNVNILQNDIYESSDINIFFTARSSLGDDVCNTPLGWQLVVDPGNPAYVTTGGALNEADKNTWFRIKKATTTTTSGKYDYQIGFCLGSPGPCFDIGVSQGADTSKLGVTDHPLIVKFQKKVDEFQNIKMVA